MPSARPEPARTLARATTPRGDIALRCRETQGGGTAYELIVGGVFAMDTIDVSTEVELARLGLAACAQPRRVLVGGLGLGFTARAVLDDPRVGAVVIAEIEPALVGWARDGLVPTLTGVVGDPRVRLHTGDVADLLTGDETFDVILLDVDNGPSFLVHQDNSSLYADPTLARALAQLAPGGALAIWAAQPEPGLLARLAALADRLGGLEVREIARTVEREGRTLTYAIYQASRKAEAARRRSEKKSGRAVDSGHPRPSWG